jgi:hypothetical protein
MFRAPLCKIQTFHVYPYSIISWINIGLGNIEGPWLVDWKFQGTLLGVRSSHCMKQNVFCAPLYRIQPFHIYPYCIISWINIGLGNIEGPWLGGWYFQGTLLGARSSHCIKQNMFRAPLYRIQDIQYIPLFYYILNKQRAIVYNRIGVYMEGLYLKSGDRNTLCFMQWKDLAPSSVPWKFQPLNQGSSIFLSPMFIQDMIE